MLPKTEMREWFKYYRSRRKATLTGNTVITQHYLYMPLGKDIGGGGCQNTTRAGRANPTPEMITVTHASRILL